MESCWETRAVAIANALAMAMAVALGIAIAFAMALSGVVDIVIAMCIVNIIFMLF